MTAERVERFWDEFVAATGIDGDYDAWAFGGAEEPDFATELALLVLNGPKRATASLAEDYADGELPESGQMSVILDGSAVPVCVIRTTEVSVARFGDVDEAFAWDEGEGDRTLDWWRRAHIDFFRASGRDLTEDSLMVLERFELLWPAR